MKADVLQIHNTTILKGEEKKNNTWMISVLYYIVCAQKAERENSKHIRNFFRFVFCSHAGETIRNLFLDVL